MSDCRRLPLLPPFPHKLLDSAERDADAELVDALHDALDVGLPAGGPRR